MAVLRGIGSGLSFNQHQYPPQVNMFVIQIWNKIHLDYNTISVKYWCHEKQPNHLLIG